MSKVARSRSSSELSRKNRRAGTNRRSTRPLRDEPGRAAGLRPTFERREYERRRARLLEGMDERCVVVIPSAPVQIRNRDIEYPYRPSSDFVYLTGFPEPRSVAVFLPGRAQGAYLLFCDERDAHTERLTGWQVGLDDACRIYGADDAFPISDLEDILPGLMEGRERVYYPMGSDPEFDRRMLTWLYENRTARHQRPPAEFVALDNLLHDLRLYKSSAELKLLREAAEITDRAHRNAMRHCRPGMREYELEAELLYGMHKAGSRGPAYPSIVASGTNACILHYTANSAVVEPDDLVLIDAGAEYHWYASDVTRTYPANGKFAAHTRDLYEVVLAAQTAAIDAVRPRVDWHAPHRAAVATLTQGLVDLGLLQGSVPELIERERYLQFCPHPTGHWLGLDVHDVGDYQIGDAARVLEPGMVLTVEPGIYVPPDHPSVDPKWCGIGIRIEDDVVVTRGGPEVLTAATPKAPADLEALVGRDA